MYVQPNRFRYRAKSFCCLLGECFRSAKLTARAEYNGTLKTIHFISSQHLVIEQLCDQCTCLVKSKHLVYLVFICVKSSQFWTMFFDFLHKVLGAFCPNRNIMHVVLCTQVPSDSISTHNEVSQVIHKTKSTENHKYTGTYISFKSISKQQSALSLCQSETYKRVKFQIKHIVQ